VYVTLYLHINLQYDLLWPLIVQLHQVLTSLHLQFTRWIIDFKYKQTKRDNLRHVCIEYVSFSFPIEHTVSTGWQSQVALIDPNGSRDSKFYTMGHAANTRANPICLLLKVIFTHSAGLSDVIQTSTSPLLCHLHHLAGTCTLCRPQCLIFPSTALHKSPPASLSLLTNFCTVPFTDILPLYMLWIVIIHI
jgi:hypothetical protein